MARDSFTGRDHPEDRAHRLNKWKADHDGRIAAVEGRTIPHIDDSTATTVAGLKADHNALLQALRDGGIMLPPE